MASQYHKMKYPYLYADPGLARAVTGSGITPLLLSELEEGGKYGPKINYGGSGTGIDPLNLAGKDGKGTGLDLVSEDEYGEPNLLFNTDMLPLGIAALEDMNEEELKRRMLQAKKPEADDEDEFERPTGPATGMTIPSSEYEKDGEVEEEEEIKTGKDYGELGFFQKLLKAATENPEATLALGRALLKGEGLGIGLADFAEEKISQDKAEAALEKEAEETLYERQMEKAKFDLDVAKANALADYYGTTSKAALLKAEKLPKEVEAAQAYALQMSGGDAVLFQEYFKEAFKMLAERSSSTQLPMFSMPGQEGDETDVGENAIDVTTRTQNELQS